MFARLLRFFGNVLLSTVRFLGVVKGLFSRAAMPFDESHPALRNVEPARPVLIGNGAVGVFLSLLDLLPIIGFVDALFDSVDRVSARL